MKFTDDQSTLIKALEQNPLCSFYLKPEIIEPLKLELFSKEFIPFKTLAKILIT